MVISVGRGKAHKCKKGVRVIVVVVGGAPRRPAVTQVVQSVVQFTVQMLESELGCIIIGGHEKTEGMHFWEG